jgi:5-oxoprolinase (ATP-hydrolysing) subunit B
LAKGNQMSAPLYPRLLPAGDTALIVELGDAVDETVNGRVLALDRLVSEGHLPGVVETLPTNRSLMLVYEPLAVSYADLVRAIEALLAQVPENPAPVSGRSWIIPVVYGGAFGSDLDEAAAILGLSPSEVIARHAARDYRVFMIGFQPGFSYLGVLDPTLTLSRRPDPRAKIPAGTVSIAGIQTVINSVEAPSGWQLIGRTPERLFDLRRDTPFLLAAGDRVRFRPVDEADWPALERRVAAGEQVAEPAP